MRVQLRFNEATADVERNSFFGSVGITPMVPYHIALRRHLWPPALEGPFFFFATKLGTRRILVQPRAFAPQWQ